MIYIKLKKKKVEMYLKLKTPLYGFKIYNGLLNKYYQIKFEIFLDYHWVIQNK